MGLKKIIAIGTVLLNLINPLYAKMYNPGLEIKIEKKYSVDLVGNFCQKETQKILRVMKSIDKKVDREKAGIDCFTIENVDNLAGKMMEEDRKQSEKGNYVFEADITKYFEETVDAEKKLIKIDSNAINNKINGKIDDSSLSGYEYMLAHAIGHLIYPKYSNEIFDKFWELNVKRDVNKKSEIPDGYVTVYPIQRPFFTRANEDFADIFSYWINNKHYADNDEIVHEKIDAVKRHTKK
jgi:hypothetical protein